MGTGLFLAGVVLAVAGVIILNIPRKYQAREVTAMLGFFFMLLGIGMAAGAVVTEQHFPSTIAGRSIFAVLTVGVLLIGSFICRDVWRHPKLWEDDTGGIMILSILSFLLAGGAFMLGLMLTQGG